MFLRELSAGLDSIKGLGPAAQRSLARLGIIDIKTLLCHYPRDWEDRSQIVPLRDWSRGKVCTLVKVLSHEWFGAGYMKTLKILVEDDTARASLVCFNRPFLAKQLPVGLCLRIFGHFYYKYGEIQSSAFEVAGERDGSLGGILPIYPLSEGLTQAMLRRFIKNALAQHAAALEDELPEEIIRRDTLLNKAEAIKAIHFPGTFTGRDLARKTLIYEELFYLEIITGLRVMERKINASDTEKVPQISGGKDEFSPLQKRLI